MLSEDEARRVLEILTDTVGKPIQERLDRNHDEIPRANNANIRMAIQALLDLKEVELIDHDAELNAAEKLLHALNRAEAISGCHNLSVADAEIYLRSLAESGSSEAQELLAAFDDPFAFE
jgi:hypothetical protein